jgi:hypothetical protein
MERCFPTSAFLPPVVDPRPWAARLEPLGRETCRRAQVESLGAERLAYEYCVEGSKGNQHSAVRRVLTLDIGIWSLLFVF